MLISQQILIMKVAIVGATGLVGGKMMQVLEERAFPMDEVLLVASEKSVGKKIKWLNKEHEVCSLEDAIAARPNLAIFSAGGNTSLQWAPRFAAVGSKVVDNSSAWRMDADKKLVVPEVNATVLTKDDFIIANPNCSTIQLVVALNPLHKKYRIKRVVVTTFQSVTGTGKKAVDQLMGERINKEVEKAYPYTIDLNAIPQCDVFLDNDYTKEEMKLSNETRKIIGDDKIQLSATCVRIPVMGGHSEAVNIEFEDDFVVEEVKEMLKNSKGIKLKDNPAKLEYPMPLLDAYNKDEVFVGRIRRDFTQKNTLNMWIVADNLRKGAATNAVQIAEYLLANKLL